MTISLEIKNSHLIEICTCIRLGLPLASSAAVYSHCFHPRHHLLLGVTPVQYLSDCHPSLRPSAVQKSTQCRGAVNEHGVGTQYGTVPPIHPPTHPPFFFASAFQALPRPKGTVFQQPVIAPCPRLIAWFFCLELSVPGFLTRPSCCIYAVSHHSKLATRFTNGTTYKNHPVVLLKRHQ